jgi:poly(hydroxyalkanoate) granule-associated protein
MARKKTIKNSKAIETNTPSEQLRRTWLAGLGAFSLTRKHGGQWFGRFAEESIDLAGRAVQFARETAADAQAHAVGFTPIVAHIEKRYGTYASAVEHGFEHVLDRLGIPTKREVGDLTRQIAALSRKLKAAK